ncbi:AAA family ATPase [Dactylosporangium sp. NPDC049742]|uniref:AAA family ATPase n=1 Tax=Dactylosporangium sp. NPDC049742 TaxID=3154737 RepID=UPI00343F226F
MSLPVRGPWVVTPTSSSVDWVVAAAALAATTGGSAAAVVLGGPPPSSQVAAPSSQAAGPSSQVAAPSSQAAGPSSEAAAPASQVVGVDAQAAGPASQAAGPASQFAVLASHVAALVELPAGTGLDAVTAVVKDLGAKHDRVVILVGDGVVTPTGGDWTVADLASAVRAPVVVVTGTGADAVGHTLLALEALDRRRVPGSVIVVGDGGDFDALPVRLAGRIPADHAAFTGDFAAAAAGWVDPLDGSGPASVQPPVVTPTRPRDLQTRVAIRAAWTLGIAFLLAIVLLCLCGGLRYPGSYT